MTSMAYFLGVGKFQHKRKITRIIIFFLSFFLLVGSILLIVGALFDIDIDQLRGFRTDALFGDAAGTSHIGGRFELWQLGLAKGMISPVFGWGFGTANNLQAELTGDTTIRAFFAPHNEFIAIFLNTGLVGLILYLSFFVGIYRKTNTMLKKNHDNFCIYMARSVQAIMVAIAFFCLGDGIWFNATIPSMLMLIFGAMYATDKASSHNCIGGDNINKV
jgi:O-antigen ligase